MTYAAFDDPYCYPGTDVLKNIPGWRDPAALAQFEMVATIERANEPLPPGHFSIRHYQAIHRHLFQDVYAWAGRFRTVRMAKDNSMFCYPENIRNEMRRLFAALKKNHYLQNLSEADFTRQAAHFLAELNAIHPFRDGNGRTQLTFMSLLAARAGHPLHLERLEPAAFLNAMIASFQGDLGPLRTQLEVLCGEQA